MTEVQVHVDIAGRTVHAGMAYFHVGRGKVTTTFVYEPAYLADPDGYDLEPGLVRKSGQQYVQGLPGVFADCAPDLWGRNLITKQRRAMQRQSKQRLPDVTDVDYLLGVSDVTRQGNLRFTLGGGTFLDPGADVPPIDDSAPSACGCRHCGRQFDP